MALNDVHEQTDPAGASSPCWFPIRSSRPFRLLFLLLGIRLHRSFVAVSHSQLEVRLGWLHLVVPREQLVCVELLHDRWLRIDRHSTRADRLAVVTAGPPVVYLRLREPQPFRMLGIRFKVRHIYASVEDAPRLVAELQRDESMSPATT